jgi:DNA-directed RNA polymerase subunit omega
MIKDSNALLNKYSLVKGAARRARQLQSGAPPLLVSKSGRAG